MSLRAFTEVPKSTPCGAETRSIALRGRAVVELEQSAEALTTSDRAGSDHGCPGRNEFVVQTLVRTFFVIMNQERAHGRAKMRFAEQYHPLQAFPTWPARQSVAQTSS